jgi:ribosomal protein S18 acetylase RimI-like enzyme
VPHDHCRKGIATKLLREALAEADKEGIWIYLEVVPTGEMPYEALVEWYKKHGFAMTEYESVMGRCPQVLNAVVQDG